MKVGLPERRVGGPPLRRPGLPRSRRSSSASCAASASLPPVPALPAALPVVPEAVRADRRARRTRSPGVDARRLRCGERALLPLQALLQPLPLHAAARVGRRLPGADAPPAAGARAARRRPARAQAHHAHRPASASSASLAPPLMNFANTQPLSRGADGEDGRHRPRLGAALLLRRDGRALVRGAAARAAAATTAARCSSPPARELQRPDRRALRGRGARARRRARRASLRALLRHALHRHRRPRRRARATPSATSPSCCPTSSAGAHVVVPGPSCSLMLKEEYPRLLAHGRRAPRRRRHAAT